MAGKFKSSKKAILWYPDSYDCPTCKRQVPRGRPSKRKRVELGKKKGEHQHGSDTESASEHEDDQMAPRVYCLSMDANGDCITKVTYTDQCAIFQELCSIIPKAQLLELLMNTLKGVYVLQEDELHDCIAKVPEDMQVHIVQQIIHE